MGKSRNQVRQTGPAIEAVLEFRQAALGIFRLERVAGTAERGLQVAQYRIHPVKPGLFDRCAPASSDHRLMGASGLCNRFEAFQAIRNHMGVTAEVPFRPPGHLRAAKPLDHAELDALRPAFPGGLHGSHKRRLAVGVASCLLATSSVWTQLGVESSWALPFQWLVICSPNGETLQKLHCTIKTMIWQGFFPFLLLFHHFYFEIRGIAWSDSEWGY